MSTKTRYFLVGSGLVVVAGLCTGLVAFYGGQSARAAVGPAELAYLPSNASVVAFADVEAIMASGFRQRLREFMPDGPERNRLLEETGIDIERDIDAVVAGLSGGGSDRPDGVVLFRGRFDRERIEALVTAHGATSRVYAGRRLLVGPRPGPGGGGDERGVVAGLVFLESDLVALGPEAALEAVVDLAAGGGGNTVQDNAPMMAFLADIAPTGNAWVVGHFDALADSPSMPDLVRSRLPGVEWLAASAQVDRGLTGFLRADTTDLEAAENLRQVIAGALAAARLAAGQQSAVDMALRSVQSSGEGNTVELSFAIEPELLDLLRQFALPGSGRPDQSVGRFR